MFDKNPKSSIDKNAQQAYFGSSSVGKEDDFNSLRIGLTQDWPNSTQIGKLPSENASTKFTTSKMNPYVRAMNRVDLMSNGTSIRGERGFKAQNYKSAGQTQKWSIPSQKHKFESNTSKIKNGKPLKPHI